MTEHIPEYSADEFYQDLHHLVQPVIGMVRLKRAESLHKDLPLDYVNERLSLALGLADLAFGQDKTARSIDLDVLRDGRADHGCGFFKNEDETNEAAITARWRARKGIQA